MSCPLCTSPSSKFIKPYAHNSDFFQDKEIRECFNCSMQYIYPMPKEEDWNAYNTSYFMNAHGGLITSPWIKAYNIGVAKVRFCQIIDWIKTSQIEVKSILEIGPGQGFLMREWLTHFPETKYYVVESDSSTHAELSHFGGVIIPSEKIQSIAPVNLIIATHVIEHTLKPIDFLSHFCSALSLDGGVFIEAPCRDHLYKNIHEPHVQFFDKNSLSLCFDAVGLTRHNIFYSGDRIKNLRQNALIKNLIVKLQRLTKIPLSFILGAHWPNKSKYNLSTREALAIVETSPHIHQSEQARWVRGFAQKVKT
jgi:hypothetical protein